MKLFTRRRSACAPTICGLVAIAALVVVQAGCSKSVSYTYVDVHVVVDPQTITRGQLATVVSCEFQVLGAEMTEGFPLRCLENKVQYDVGTFSWTSNASSGSLQFRVRLFAVNRVVVGEATSEAIPVSRGEHLRTEVLVVGIPPTSEPDGGDDGSSPPDGGFDTGPDATISTDALLEARPDLAADQSTAPDSGSPDQTTDVGSDTASDRPGDAAVESMSGSDAPGDRPPADGSGDGG